MVWLIQPLVGWQSFSNCSRRRKSSSKPRSSLASDATFWTLGTVWFFAASSGCVTCQPSCKNWRSVKEVVEIFRHTAYFTSVGWATANSWLNIWRFNASFRIRCQDCFSSCVKCRYLKIVWFQLMGFYKRSTSMFTSLRLLMTLSSGCPFCMSISARAMTSLTRTSCAATSSLNFAYFSFKIDLLDSYSDCNSSGQTITSYAGDK